MKNPGPKESVVPKFVQKEVTYFWKWKERDFRGDFFLETETKSDKNSDWYKPKNIITYFKDNGYFNDRDL